MKTKINILVEMPDKIKEEYKKQSLYDKVQDYILVCESDEDSYHHWNYLKCLYNKLHEKNNLPEKLLPVLEILEEFMSKHGMYDSGENPAQMEGKSMFKYLGDN